jgi:hypothetical protein
VALLRVTMRTADPKALLIFARLHTRAAALANGRTDAFRAKHLN